LFKVHFDAGKHFDITGHLLLTLFRTWSSETPYKIKQNVWDFSKHTRILSQSVSLQLLFFRAIIYALLLWISERYLSHCEDKFSWALCMASRYWMMDFLKSSALRTSKSSTSFFINLEMRSKFSWAMSWWLNKTVNILNPFWWYSPILPVSFPTLKSPVLWAELFRAWLEARPLLWPHVFSSEMWSHFATTARLLPVPRLYLRSKGYS